MRVSIHEDAAFRMLCEGSLEGFDYYYYTYHQAIYANICKIVRDPESAEDILQEVFLAFWENRQKLHTQQSVPGWLFVVSHNKSVSFLKQKLKTSTVLLADPAMADRLMEVPEVDEAFYQKQLQILEAAISHLPGRKQMVFRLCRFEGKSMEEAAQILGISATSVKSYLKESSRMLREYIQKYYAAELSLAGILWLITAY